MFCIIIIFYCSDTNFPAVFTKDTQTDNVDSTPNDDEKTDDDKIDKKETKHWSVDRIKKEYRKFNIDLAPKVNMNWKKV